MSSVGLCGNVSTDVVVSGFTLMVRTLPLVSVISNGVTVSLAYFEKANEEPKLTPGEGPEPSRADPDSVTSKPMALP